MAATAACYAVCGTTMAACVTAAGFIHGTLPGTLIAAVPALSTCNAQFAACEAACMATAGVEAAGALGALGGIAGLAGAAGALPVVAVVGAVGYLFFW